MNDDYMAKIVKDDCVLMIIDCQHDFLDPGAPLENSVGRSMVPQIIEARKWAKDNDIPVVYTQEIHRRQKIDFGMEMERGDPEHCLEDTIGCEIIPELTPDNEDFVVVKRRYSGFYKTDLEILLRGLDRHTLIMMGFDTNVCVYSTALDAQFRGFRVIALSDCTYGTTKELTGAFLENISYILGEVMTLPELVEILG